MVGHLFGLKHWWGFINPLDWRSKTDISNDEDLGCCTHPLKIWSKVYSWLSSSWITWFQHIKYIPVISTVRENPSNWLLMNCDQDIYWAGHLWLLWSTKTRSSPAIQATVCSCCFFFCFGKSCKRAGKTSYASNIFSPCSRHLVIMIKLFVQTPGFSPYHSHL